MKEKGITRLFLGLVMSAALGVAAFSLLAGIGCHRLREYQLYGGDREYRLASQARRFAGDIMQIYLSQGKGKVDEYASENNVSYVLRSAVGRRLGGNYRSDNLQQIQKLDGQVLQYTFWFLEITEGAEFIPDYESNKAEYMVQIAYLNEKQVWENMTRLEGLPDDLQYWISGFYVAAGTALMVAIVVFGVLLRGIVASDKKRSSYTGKLFMPLEKLILWGVAAVPVWFWGGSLSYVWDIPITWANGSTVMPEQLGQCIARMTLWWWLQGTLLLGFVLHLVSYGKWKTKKSIRMFGGAADTFRRIWNQLSWFQKVLTVLLLFCAVEAVGIGLVKHGLTQVKDLEILRVWLTSQGKWIIWGLWGLEKVFLAILALRVAESTMRLRISGQELARGNLGYQIPLEGMSGELLQFAQDMNAISHVVADAVEDQIKSDHLKTELITNVSHDIKTPLTSIINYADLIGRQPLDNETITEYAQVLYRQSTRLKKLIEDLMEVSKATTGNLEVYLERCQAGVILSQAMGEFEQRLQERGIDIIVRQREEPVWIMADPRMLWRILDNLMTNICKYAQSDTRVYLLLEERDNQAVMSFKNISAQPLEIDSAELMERFVRGDKSRHTEGSGLGLAIARSLTELQGGNMQLVTDGDLFKVILTFPIAEEISLETEHITCITGDTIEGTVNVTDLE